MKGRIYLKDWLELKPYENQTNTDLYYLGICNKIKKSIISGKANVALDYYLKPKQVDLLSCFLTSYLEDLISETNIWNSFVRRHQSMYDKPLPFYPCDDYIDEEINYTDVCFLVWYFITSIHETKIIEPISMFIMNISKGVMDEFELAWEYAPANTHLKSHYSIKEDENDFYVARELIDIVLFKTYLFYPDVLVDLMNKEFSMIEESKDDENIFLYLNENRDETLQNAHTRLLSLTGKEWVNEILPDDHSLRKEYLNISKKIRGYFLYKGQDDDFIFIEHIASGKKFDLIKKSFNSWKTLTDIDTILYIGITRWKNEWWFSGVSFEQPFNADLILDEKNSIERRMDVSFLDDDDDDIEDVLQSQFSAFLKYNKGSQIAFLPSSEVDNFVTSFIDFFNSTLDLNEEEIEEAEQRARDRGYLGLDDGKDKLTESDENALVFFNPKRGLEMAQDLNSAFPTPENSFYDKKLSSEHMMYLMFSDEFSVGLVNYALSLYKDESDFFKEGFGAIIENDIDFMLRFWKKDKYHVDPGVAFAG